jgi:hypothetical protein
MNELSTYVQEEISTILPAFDVEDYKEFKITPEETLFVYKYTETSDVGKAYQIVFGESSYTKAKSAGSKLLKRKDIQAALSKMNEEIFEYALKSLPNALMQDILNIRNINIFDFYKDDGHTAKTRSEIPEDKQYLIEDTEIIVNSRTGEVLTHYVLPSKSGTTKLMLELLKLRDMSKGGASETSLSDAMRTAAAKRAEVFANIDMEALK